MIFLRTVKSDSEQETEGRSQVRRMMQMLDDTDHTSHQLNPETDCSRLRKAIPRGGHLGINHYSVTKPK